MSFRASGRARARQARAVRIDRRAEQRRLLVSRRGARRRARAASRHGRRRGRDRLHDRSGRLASDRHRERAGDRRRARTTAGSSSTRGRRRGGRACRGCTCTSACRTPRRACASWSVRPVAAGRCWRCRRTRRGSRGERTGLLSTRAEILGLLPRHGAPPRFESWADWERLVRRFVDAGLAPGYGAIHWDMRPIRSSARSRCACPTSRRTSRVRARSSRSCTRSPRGRSSSLPAPAVDRRPRGLHAEPLGRIALRSPGGADPPRTRRATPSPRSISTASSSSASARPARRQVVRGGSPARLRRPARSDGRHRAPLVNFKA